MIRVSETLLDIESRGCVSNYAENTQTSNQEAVIGIMLKILDFMVKSKIASFGETVEKKLHIH